MSPDTGHLVDQQADGLRFRLGDAALRSALSAWWSAGAGGGELLRDNPRRRLVRLPGAAPGGGDCLVKHFRLGSGRHRRRERLKAWLGRGPADREARHLGHLHAHGVPVPRPLALAHVTEGPSRGDALLVLPFLVGEPLEALLERRDPELRSRLVALGGALAAMHAAGIVHGDLHDGNVLVLGSETWILDLQHASTRASRARRLRDLGELDFALWDRVSSADRLRLRRAALGLGRRRDPEALEALREVGRAAQARAWRHGRSRTRRCLRPGRLYARAELAAGHGLRWREFPLPALKEALEGHREALASTADDPRVWKRDERSRITAVEAAGRPVVVKEVLPRGLGRLLADALRGSPARRAWRGGHGLAMRGIGAARPLAFLERRTLGLPRASWVVLERLDGWRDAVSLGPEQPERVLDALAGLLDQLHRRGVIHGDLKGNHVLLPVRGEGAPHLIDLEGVRFRPRLDEAERLEALVQLNASLPDGVSSALRRQRLLRYLARHPFDAGRDATLKRLVAQSLARAHRWSGQDCRCAREGSSAGG